MTKTMKNNLHEKEVQTSRTMKRYLIVFGAMLITTALIVSISFTLAASSVQTANVAGPETQFELSVAYAYVGEGPVNDSFVADNDFLMSPKSNYPSAVKFNITRLPGTQIESCDAVIEFYSVQITTDTGVLEKNCYFIGTNYSPSFSSAQLSTLFEYVNDVASPKDLTTSVRGNFEFNMTENTSFLSTTVGSSGVYTTGSSSQGLWLSGEPNVVSVTVQRIGYLTINNNSVSIFKDSSSRAPTATAQLSNHESGFLHNTLVPVDKLPQTDLFHP
jgi:hypothetical protein